MTGSFILPAPARLSPTIRVKHAYRGSSIPGSPAETWNATHNKNDIFAIPIGFITHKLSAPSTPTHYLQIPADEDSVMPQPSILFPTQAGTEKRSRVQSTQKCQDSKSSSSTGGMRGRTLGCKF